MYRYVARRLAQATVVMVGVTLIVFVLVNLVGDPVQLMLPEDATQEDIDTLRTALGLDRPVMVRYVIYLRGLLRGEFGRSFRYQEQALPLVLERLPVTATLAGLSLLLALCISIPLGVAAAINRNTWIDLLASATAVLGRAMPGFWLGIMLILAFSVWRPIFPVSGYESPMHLVLPVVTLGTGMAAASMRLVRSSLLEVIRQDYVTTARAKGLPERIVLFKHALRNALIPVITMLGLQLPVLVGGAVIVETVFAIPGVGRLTVKALTNLDMAIVQASVVVVSLAIVLSNLIVDLLYGLVDPRIRYN